MATAVIVVAGLASLATSQIPRGEDSTTGHTAVGSEPVDLRAAIQVRGFREPYAGDSVFEFQLRTGGGGGTAPSSTQVQLVPAGASDAEIGWTTLPVSAPLDASDCTVSCTFEYTIRLRAAGNYFDPVVIPWRAYAIVYGDVSDVDLTIDSPGEAPALGDIGRPALLGGLMVGLVAAAIGLVRRWRESGAPPSRWASREAVGAIALIAAGAFVAAGALSGLATAVAGVFLIIGGTALLVPLASKRTSTTTSTKILALLGLIAVPFVLARFATAGEFRQTDAAIGLAAAGFVAGLAAWAALGLAWPLIHRLRLLNVRTWVVAAIATVLFVVGLVWTLLITAGATPFSVLVAVPFGAVYVAIAVAWWRWLDGDCVTPFIVGISLIAAAGLAFAGVLGSALAFFGQSDRIPAPNAIESCVVIALGGLLFGLLTLMPPSVRYAFPPGRPLQHRWAYPASPRRSDGSEPAAFGPARIGAPVCSPGAADRRKAVATALHRPQDEGASGGHN